MSKTSRELLIESLERRRKALARLGHREAAAVLDRRIEAHIRMAGGEKAGRRARLAQEPAPGSSDKPSSAPPQDRDKDPSPSPQS